MLHSRKLGDILSDKRTLRAAVIVGLAAVVMIYLSSVIDFSPDTDRLSEEYAATTEERLLRIIGRIEGVGEAEIFLTMDNGIENVYLKNSDTKTVSIEPKVRGVVIVCDGGDDPIVAAHVLDAVTKSLNINSDKVCITK